VIAVTFDAIGTADDERRRALRNSLSSTDPGVVHRLQIVSVSGNCAGICFSCFSFHCLNLRKPLVQLCTVKSVRSAEGRFEMRVPTLALLASAVLLVSGCSTVPVATTTQTPGGAAPGMMLRGKVHGGQQPVAGASVYLFAAGTGGNGNGSSSLLTAGAGKDTFNNYYVTTASDGTFTISGDYTCTSPSAQTYIYSIGGNSGGGPNPAIGLMAAVGTCSSLKSTTYVVVDEVSTVATAYALAGYATDPTHISSSSTAPAVTGVANAFAAVTNLEALGTGLALATTPGGNGTVPQSEINTLADILAGCVNSSGSGSTGCTSLFSNAMNGSTAPTDTATAAVNIAHNPGANIGNLFALQTASAPFQPALSAAPNDFAVAVSYTGGGLNSPVPVAIDAAGNVWVGNTATGVNSVSKFTPVGVPISGVSGYTGGGIVDPYSIAIDNSGNVWTGNVTPDTLSELNNTGTPISGSSGYTGGHLNAPYDIAFDGSGNLWVVNNVGQSLSEFSSTGSPITTSAAYTGGGLNDPVSLAIGASGNVWVTDSITLGALSEFNSAGASPGSPISTSAGYTGGGLNDPWGLAVDANGNVWVANSGTGANSISEFSSSGTPISSSSGFTGGGLNIPEGIAIDGAGKVWVANRATNQTSPPYPDSALSEFNSSGIAISPSTGYQAGLNLNLRVAIDGSGNVWVTNAQLNSVTEFVGAASPVITPLVANLPAGSSGSPGITSILPNPAAVGTSVTITGTNFGATQGGSTVTFNGTAASPTNWSATSISVPVPVGATTGNVIVNVGGQASSGYEFTISLPVPNITSIEPNPAAVGTSVTITGTNFGASQGEGTLTFNGTAASPSGWSDTSITTLVPAGATTGDVIVTVGGQASSGYAFTVSGGTMPGDAITWRYDNSLDGLNATETTLTTTNVNSTSFGKVGEFTVNGRIDGEVLYLSQISISGQMKNVIYFATENDVVYAVDADSISGSTATILWSMPLVPSGEAPASDKQQGSTCGNVSPTGIEGTPVIDRGRNAIYVVTKTMSTTTNTTQFFRIHALNLTNGNELFGGPTTITGTFPGTEGNVSGGVVTFSPRDQSNRPALLESGGYVYVAFGGQAGDCGEYSGFLMSYNADTLEQNSAIDLNPNSVEGGMWNSGASPSADNAGSVYVATANTGDDNSIGPNDYPDSVVRLTNSGALTVADYFTPFNAETLDKDDLDLGSAGVLILPDVKDNESVVHQYAVAAGKDGNMYVVDRGNLGQFNISTNNTVQTISINGSPDIENFSTPAYFNNNVYVCSSGQTLKAFAITNAMLATTATMHTTAAVGTSGFTISANGTSNGIVWALQPATGNGVLYAFNAANLSSMLYASNQASGNRDQTAAILGNFHTPMVANGRVYFGTGSTVAVFGLLPP
jgi:IPT/TIG domain/NHL repeat